jgi:hypothetical protein
MVAAPITPLVPFSREKELPMSLSRRGSLVAFVALLVLTLPVLAEKVPDKMLEGIKLGDWVEHRMVTAPELQMQTTVKQTVTEVTEDEVTVEHETSTTMSGKPLPSQKMAMKRPRFVEKPVDAPKPAELPVAKSTEKLKASDGKDYTCQVYEQTIAGKVSKSYLSSDIPLGGIVLSEMDGKHVLELVGWGRGR